MVQNKFLEAVQKPRVTAREMVSHPIYYKEGDLGIRADFHGAAYIFGALKTWAADRQVAIPYDALQSDNPESAKSTAWSGAFISEEGVVEEALRHMYGKSEGGDRTEPSRFHALFNLARYSRDKYWETISNSEDILAVFSASQAQVPVEPHANQL